MLDLIGAYENYLTKVKQASANTIASYMRDIRQYAAWLQDECDVDVIDAIREWRLIFIIAATFMGIIGIVVIFIIKSQLYFHIRDKLP